MRKAIQVLILLLAVAGAALGQTPAQCRVSKTFLTLSGQPDKYATVTLFQIKLGGVGQPAYTTGRAVYRTDSQGRLLGADGVTVGVDLPQGAFVWLYSGANAQLVNLAANPNAGTQYQVPNKTAAGLEELIWGLATIKLKGALLIGGTNGIASQFAPCPDGQVLIWDSTQALGARCGTVSGGGGAVTSVYGRTGAVVAQTGDYSFGQISGVLGGGQFPAALPAIDASLAMALNASNLASGTVPLARISGLTDTQVAAGAGIAQTKIANLVSDLAGKAAASHTHPSTDISDSTSAGRILLTAASAAAQRTALGLATVASTGAYSDLSGLPTLPYDLATQIVSKPDAAATVLMFSAVRSFTLAVTGSTCKALTAATAQTDFDVQVNGVSKGTLRFAAGGTTCAIVSPTSTAIVSGDIVKVVAPAQDATLADIGITLKGNQ